MRSISLDGLTRASAIVLLTAAMSVRIAAAENSQDEYARVADWRAKRLASLTSETGWLTPIALYWLKDGENSFGRRRTELSRWMMPPWRPTRVRSS